MDSMTWQQPRGSVFAEKTTWLLMTAFALLLAGMMVNQSTTAFFTDTRVVSGNNFITASVALNETPFTAFNFEKFVPGDVFVRPVQVTNSTASNSGAINVNYYMTVKDNFSNCSTQDPKCTDAKGTLSDPVNGLRLVAIRCFLDPEGTVNVACESASLRSVRPVKGVMETIWPGGATNATTDIAGVVRDRNETVQYGNVGGTGSEAISNFPGLPNGGNASDYFGRPIVFARAGALSTQPISVKINPRRNDTNNPAQLGSSQLTNTANPVVQGSDVLRIGGTLQDLDGNWARAALAGGAAAASGYQACGDIAVSQYSTNLTGCGAEIVGVPIQTLSNPNCNGIATNAPNRAVVNATGNQGSQAGPGANPTVISVNDAARAPQVFSTQSQGACFMGGSDYEKNAPIVLSPRINNQLMAAGGGDTPRIVSDIPAQSLFDQVNTIAGLGAGKSDSFALIVYLPSWSTQSTQDEVASTSLTVQSRQTVDAQNNPVSVPIGGAGNKSGGRASYTVAFTAVQPVGQTFALANVAQQSVNTLQALAGQIQANNAAFQAQSSDTAVVGTDATLLTGGIQTLSPNLLPGNGRQIISVTGRGFAKVTAIPQNVKVEKSDFGGTIATGTYKYVVTAGKSAITGTGGAAVAAAPANNESWDQGEPSTEVTVTTTGTASQTTITWNLVPGADNYNIYRKGPGATDVKRISVVGATAAANSVPGVAGFQAGAVVGVVDNGGATLLTDHASTFPAVGRPCVQYAASATFGMCPKIEILGTGGIDATGGTALNTGVFDTVSSTAFAVRTGEVLKGQSGVARSGQNTVSVTAYASATDGENSGARGVLQLDASKTTGAVDNYLAGTDNTVGFLSSNQVTFEVQSPNLYGGTITKYGVRITNPGHPSLPLDLRGKVLALSDSLSVQPQAIDSYTPGSIGRISTGNTLVIKGSGFQKGSIVQLGVYSKTTTVSNLAKANLVQASGDMLNGKVNGTTNTFVSKSHIVNRLANTRTELGTWYATGYDKEAAAPSGSDAIGTLYSKDYPAGALAADTTINAKPWFSYDHNKVVVNNAGQITVTDITLTNVNDAPVVVAAKVFNPDGSVVEGALFKIAAPGIEQIVQVDGGGSQWLSAAQGRTVKLRFQATSANTFLNTAGGLPPTVKISCYAVSTGNSSPNGSKQINAEGAQIAASAVSATNQAYDPCFNSATGSTNVGVSQVGDLKVISRSSAGDAVEGTFAIAADATVALRKFIMTNGDAAVFSNYFSISQAPTFAQVSYTSGTNRIVADNIAQTTLSSAPAAGFNVVGKLPRGATRRVLITGTGFVRGSFAPMPDPLGAPSTTGANGGTIGESQAGQASVAADVAASTDSDCASCFGLRSASSMVNAAKAATTTPKIEFSNAGVSVNAALTTVTRDAAVDLNMATSAAQTVALAQPFIATQRLTAVFSVTSDAVAGPVTMTITNPDGGKIIVPNAFIVDGVPTIDVTRNSVITGAAIVTESIASIKQGEVKAAATSIFIYGSGFFGAPQVAVSGTGVRVTSVRLSTIDPGTTTGQTVTDTDTNLFDTVLRVELAAESTAPRGSRDITIVLPDGQSVTKTGVFMVFAP